MKEKVAPALMEVNKCPDFVMDRGHYFPWFDSIVTSNSSDDPARARRSSVNRSDSGDTPVDPGLIFG